MRSGFRLSPVIPGDREAPLAYHWRMRDGEASNLSAGNPRVRSPRSLSRGSSHEGASGLVRPEAPNSSCHFSKVLRPLSRPASRALADGLHREDLLRPCLHSSSPPFSRLLKRISPLKDVPVSEAIPPCRNPVVRNPLIDRLRSSDQKTQEGPWLRERSGAKQLRID